MMDPGLGAGASWSYTADFRREGVAMLRESRAEATVTAIDEAQFPQADQEADSDAGNSFSANREVRFERDAEIGALLFQVVNTQSDEVIFQLPTEIMLNLRKFYAENEPPSIPTFSASL